LVAEETKQPAAETKTVRLVTVGNSFSRNATNHLSDLAEAAGHRLVHRPVVVGGASFELHATKALAHLENAEDPAGRYNDGASLIEILKEDAWDYVSIQQASIKSHDLTTFQPWAGQLAALIAEHAPSAQLLIHQTWAYRSD